METGFMNRIIGLVLALVVGGLLVGGLLIPSIEGMTATEKTLENEGYFRMAHYDATTDHVISWTYEKPNIITVDGEDVTINYTVKNGQVTVIADTNWLARLYTDGSGNAVGITYLYESGGSKNASVTDSQTATFTLSAGTASITCGTYTGSATFADLYVPSNDGPFIMKDVTKNAFILNDSKIIGYGLTRIDHAGGKEGSPGTGFEFIGTYDDGIEGRVWRGTDTTVSDVEINAIADSNYVGVYKFSSIAAVATYTETVSDETVTTDTDLTYNYVIVPYQITAELSNHMTPTEIAMFGVISILGIVALVVVAANGIRNKY